MIRRLCSCRWEGAGGRSHGRAAIISAIISGIFVCYLEIFIIFVLTPAMTTRPVPVTQGWNEIQTERVTDGRQVIYQSIAELIGLTR